MKQYNVQITDRALNDMQAIYDYISGTLLAPEAALDQYGRIADAVEALSTFPSDTGCSNANRSDAM